LQQNLRDSPANLPTARHAGCPPELTPSFHCVQGGVRARVEAVWVCGSNPGVTTSDTSLRRCPIGVSNPLQAELAFSANFKGGVKQVGL